MPVIFLTSKDEEIDELFGLKMAPTISSANLLAAPPGRARQGDPTPRGTKTVSAPKETDAAKVLERGLLRMDPERHTCTWKNEPVTLTVTGS